MSKYCPLLFIIIIFFLSSCEQTIYFPQHVNIANFRHKGEYKVNFSTKLPSDDAAHILYVSPSLEGAYAVTNHIAVIGSYHTVTRCFPLDTLTGHQSGDDRPEIGGHLLGHSFEIGGGYYKKLGSLGTYEAIAGYGNGVINRTSESALDVPALYDFKARYNNWFLQTSFGLYLHHHVTLSVGFRAQTLHCSKFDSHDPRLTYLIMYGQSVTKMLSVQSQNYGYLQHYLNLEAGGNHIKFNLQLGLSFSLTPYTVGSQISAYCTLGIEFCHFPHGHWWQ